MHIWMPNNHSILLNPVNWSILFGVVVWEGVNTFLVPKSYFGLKIVFFYPQIGKTQFVDQFSTDSGTKKKPRKNYPFPFGKYRKLTENLYSLLSITFCNRSIISITMRLLNMSAINAKSISSRVASNGMVAMFFIKSFISNIFQIPRITGMGIATIIKIAHNAQQALLTFCVHCQ